METPQIIYLIINVISATVHLTKLGEPKTGNYEALPVILWVILTLPLLYWGGFFG